MIPLVILCEAVSLLALALRLNIDNAMRVGSDQMHSLVKDVLPAVCMPDFLRAILCWGLPGSDLYSH